MLQWNKDADAAGRGIDRAEEGHEQNGCIGARSCVSQPGCDHQAGCGHKEGAPVCSHRSQRPDGRGGLDGGVDSQVEEPNEKDLFNVGTVGVIMRMLKLPDGRIRVLVQGVCRARIDEFVRGESFTTAYISAAPPPFPWSLTSTGPT